MTSDAFTIERSGPWSGATDEEARLLAARFGWDYFKTVPEAYRFEPIRIGAADHPCHRWLVRGLCVAEGADLPTGHARENLLFLGREYAGLWLLDCAGCGGARFVGEKSGR